MLQLYGKGNHCKKNLSSFPTYNHGQIIWDEHVKNNIFKKYITYPSQRRPPPPRNNVDVHLNYHGKNCDTCGNNKGGLTTKVL